MEEVKCELCGVKFKCCTSDYCWCMEESIIDIDSSIEKCICKDCLRKKNGN